MCKRSVDIWGHLYHVLSVNSLIQKEKFDLIMTSFRGTKLSKKGKKKGLKPTSGSNLSRIRATSHVSFSKMYDFFLDVGWKKGGTTSIEPFYRCNGRCNLRGRLSYRTIIPRGWSRCSSARNPRCRRCCWVRPPASWRSRDSFRRTKSRILPASYPSNRAKDVHPSKKIQRKINMVIASDKGCPN